MTQPTSDDIEKMIDAAARGSMEKRAKVIEDADLREQLLAYRNESIGLMVLRDKGTISQTKFEKQSMETTERHLQLIKARDAAKELEGAENAARIIRNSPEPGVDLTKYIRKLEGEVNNEE